MKYELRKLSFGEVLGEAFNLYFDNFVALILIASFSNIPTLIMQFNGVDDTGFGRLGQIIVGLMVYSLSTALIIELVSKKYLKIPQTIGQYFNTVLRFFFPLIGLILAQGVLIGTPAFVLGFISPTLLVIYFFPAIYVVIGFIFAAQALVVEKIGISKSIERSFFLTKGKKLETFGFLIFIGILNYLGSQFLFKIVLPLIRDSGMAVNTKITVWYIFAVAVPILLSPIGSCILIVVYLNLRIRKEGFGLEHLVDQFQFSGPDSPDSPDSSGSNIGSDGSDIVAAQNETPDTAYMPKPDEPSPDNER